MYDTCVSCWSFKTELSHVERGGATGLSSQVSCFEKTPEDEGLIEQFLLPFDSGFEVPQSDILLL